jgi:DNA polymerase V
LLTDFVDASVYQPSLFFNSDPKHKKLMEVIDKLNDKYHRDVIRLASQDERKHKMKQVHLSPHYTTDINEILTVEV